MAIIKTKKQENVLRELWNFGKKNSIKISKKDLTELRKNESRFL